MQARNRQLEMVWKYWEWFILAFKFMDANEKGTNSKQQFLWDFWLWKQKKGNKHFSFGIFDFWWIKQDFFFSFLWPLKGWTERTQIKQMQEQNLKQKKLFFFNGFSVYEWKHKCKQIWMMQGYNGPDSGAWARIPKCCGHRGGEGVTRELI